jgi:hypothetical protein
MRTGAYVSRMHHNLAGFSVILVVGLIALVGVAG